MGEILNSRWIPTSKLNSKFFILRAPESEFEIITRVVSVMFPDIKVYRGYAGCPDVTMSHGLPRNHCLKIDQLMEVIDDNIYSE